MDAQNNAITPEERAVNRKIIEKIVSGLINTHSEHIRCTTMRLCMLSGRFISLRSRLAFAFRAFWAISAPSLRCAPFRLVFFPCLRGGLCGHYPRDVQDCRNTVIPAQAGIQTRDFNPASLDSRLRGSDEKIQLAHFAGHSRVLFRQRIVVY